MFIFSPAVLTVHYILELHLILLNGFPNIKMTLERDLRSGMVCMTLFIMKSLKTLRMPYAVKNELRNGIAIGKLILSGIQILSGETCMTKLWDRPYRFPACAGNDKRGKAAL